MRLMLALIGSDAAVHPCDDAVGQHCLDAFSPQEIHECLQKLDIKSRSSDCAMFIDLHNDCEEELNCLTQVTTLDIFFLVSLARRISVVAWPFYHRLNGYYARNNSTSCTEAWYNDDTKMCLGQWNKGSLGEKCKAHFPDEEEKEEVVDPEKAAWRAERKR
eukprot:gene926-1069_t